MPTSSRTALRFLRRFTFDAAGNGFAFFAFSFADIVRFGTMWASSPTDAMLALGVAAGLSRVDFFVTRDTEEIVFNEINTLPGFTSISMYPKMWISDGVSYSELIDRVIAFALEEN